MAGSLRTNGHYRGDLVFSMIGCQPADPAPAGRPCTAAGFFSEWHWAAAYNPKHASSLPKKESSPFFFGSRGTLPLQRPVYIVDRCLYYQSKEPMGLQAHADYDLRSHRLQSTSSECGEAMSPSSRLHKSPLQRANNVSVL